ncbi:MAG TPA: hypothetical protein VMB50_22580 [Myxococcales bacterium]|jgi:hypothetical protein|nr:hypothetical protein [Myxococcales bacterium]
MRPWLVGLGALLWCVAPAALSMPSATIDWEKRTITATGQGAPDLNAPNPAAARIGAERAAQLDAFRNLLETLKGVKVSEGQTAGDRMAGDATLKAEVEGVLRNFTVVARHYFSDGGVELEVRMPLDGKVAELLIPKDPTAAVSQGGTDIGSGLVVVAKGLAVTPALAPRLLDPEGKVVYGPGFVQVDALKQNGIAGYLKDLTAASQSARVGSHPLLVKAVATKGTDLVISDQDAQKLEDGHANLGFLSEGKVIIVID